MKYYCCNENRRDLVRKHDGLNGIDYIEVIDNPDDPDAIRQRVLFVYFLKDLEGTVTTENIRLKVGEIPSTIVVLDVITSDTDDTDSVAANAIKIQLDQAGDFSLYTLCLVDSEDKEKELEGMDKLLSCIDFSFKVACATDGDCKETPPSCESEDRKDVPINYLAKDYASFKQLMLDRMAVLMPQWQERNAADLGITLVELLAYAADQLSYRQDAIATEAYLRTARKRRSVRRHARLVDYYMHEGLNARAWVRIEVKNDSDGLVLKKHFEDYDPEDPLKERQKTKFLTGSGTSDVFKHDNKKFQNALQQGARVYELMYDLTLYTAHNKIPFYTYGDTSCCLPIGATEATLEGRFPNLTVGDVVMLVEVKGPETGIEADADPTHRHVVRITEIIEDQDVNFNITSETPEPFIEITQIKWSEEDALPFPLCVSAMDSDSNDFWEDISEVHGNIALVDHGMTITDEPKKEALFENLAGSVVPSEVPKAKKTFVAQSNSMCAESEENLVGPRYTPVLNGIPITHSSTETLDPKDKPITELDLSISVSSLQKQGVRGAKPQITLHELTKNTEGEDTDWNTTGLWVPMKDLLIDSDANSQHFVAEFDEEGKCSIRFGDDINGKLPNSGSKFLSQYRIGNGKMGNVGTGAIRHMVSEQSVSITSISNPLPATGGTDPETLEEVKQYAPEAFRTQERAVTREDYEYFSKVCKPDIQNSTATFRWTGSWHTAFVSADRFGDKPVGASFEKELRSCLEKYRMAGIDLEVDAPVPVGLEIEMEVCIGQNYFQSEIRGEMMRLFSNRTLGSGKTGMFHPDKFSFGQSVFLSSMYALAQSVEGVTSVKVLQFRRMDTLESGLKPGVLTFNRREIPRLDNDPNYRNRGILRLQIKGGR